MKLAYLCPKACHEFDPGNPHPEVPGRLSAINDHLISLRLRELLMDVEASPASDEQLLRVHSREYLDMLAQREPVEGTVALDADTWLVPGIVNAARHAAGAVVGAVDMVMKGDATRAFCAVRPPGHHAEREHAFGFCLYNNIAVGTAHALAVHRLKRVAIVDFDAHWGNGTDAIFLDEKRVGVFASFQEHLFPPQEAMQVPGRIVNRGLGAGAKGREVRQVWHDELLPALDAFRPQLLFISAGFDGHREDEMSELMLNEEDYAWLTERIAHVAGKHARGRIVSVLEGGYALSALGRSVAAHVRALLEG